MKDKIKKIIIGLFLLFVFITPTYAKKMTVSELEKEVEERVSGAREIYVIGNYAFTNKHELQIQDFMLAAKTISVAGEGKDYSQAAYDAMTINRISRDRDENTGSFTAWEIQSKNLVGTTELTDDTELDIRYIDYNFIPEETKINKENVIFKDFDSQYTEKFSEYGFTANDNTLKFDYDASNNTLNVTGVALKNTTIGEKYGDASLKYFLGIVFEMEVPEGYDPTIIGKSWNIKDPNGKKLEFEVRDGDKKGLTLLIALSPDAKEKISTLEIDLDGAGEDYKATTLTIDWSKLKFEGETKVTVGDRAENQKDIADLNSWDYTIEDSYNITPANNYKFNVTGKVKQQTLHDGVFATPDGYYFVYTLKVENLTEDVKVTLPNGTGKTKTIGYSSFNDDGTLTVLHKINLEAGKTFEVKVDADGDCEEDKCKAYDEVTYTFDFTDLKLVKETSLTVEEIDNDADAKEQLKTSFDYDLSTVNGYNTKFNIDKNNVTITGLLPIYNSIKADTFTEPTNYYLGLTLNLAEQIKDSTEITIPDNAKMVNKVEGQNKVYVLVMLNPEDSTKEFAITVDLDGESEEYEAVTYTFNWTDTGLKFQKESTGVQYQIIDFSAEYYEHDGVINQEAKNKLTTTYGYNKDLTNVTYVSPEDHNQGIQGIVKEQTLLSAADYNDKSTGYFVAIKVIVPETQKYSSNWRLYIDKGDGNFVEQTPITTFYDAVLFRLDNVNKTPITYKVDFDGQGNYEYIEKEYTIPCAGVTFEPKASITYNFLDENGAKTNKTFNENLYIGDKIGSNVPELDTVPYHTFAGWYDGEEKVALNNAELETKTLDKNLTLTAHWTLDADAYIQAVINEINNTNKNVNYTFSKSGNNITIDVKEPHTLLSDLNKTIIPEKIAEVLGKGEIKDITLKINEEKTVTFNANESKDNIASAAENLYKELLTEEKANTTTISDIANSANNSYSLVIGALDNTVTLENSNSDYKFTFESKYLIVKTEEELRDILSNRETKSKVQEILIANDIANIASPFVVNRRVTIKGDNNASKSLTGNGIATMFDIKYGPVTFDHLEVAGLTEAAFRVEGNAVATVNIDNLTFETEKYDIPAVQVKNDTTATINLKNNGYTANKVIKEKITDYEDLADKSSHSDKKEKDSSYEYVNYYNQEKNSHIYTITFTNFKSRVKFPFTRYAKAGESPKLPTDEDEFLKTFKEFDYDGEHYTNIGYSTSVAKDVFATDDDTSCSTNKPKDLYDSSNPLPKAYADAEYYPSFCISVKSNAVHVDNVSDFISELKGSKRVIYVDTNSLDLTKVTDEQVLPDGVLTINRAVTIIGKNPIDKKRQLNVKAINITASNVVIQNLTINASDASTNDGAVINVKENDFEFLSSVINYTGSVAVANALKITDETSIRANIRWSDFKGNVQNYINIDGPLADNSIINLNSFYAKNASEDYSDIIIKTFAAGNPTIRISSNTPSNRENNGNKYYVKLLKEASGKTATLETESGNNTKLFVEANSDHKTFGGITIRTKNHTNVTVKYLINDEEKDTLANDGGTDIQKVQSE